MATVAVVAAIPVAILISGDGEDPGAEITLDPANEFDSRKLGIRGSAPGGWEVDVTPSHVLARSASGLGRVVITVPGPSAKAKRYFEEAIASLGRIFDRARPSKTLRDARIDDRPTRTRFVALERPDGTEVQAAVAVAEGRRMAYLVEVFVTEGAPARRINEAEALIDSLELSR